VVTVIAASLTRATVHAQRPATRCPQARPAPRVRRHVRPTVDAGPRRRRRPCSAHAPPSR